MIENCGINDLEQIEQKLNSIDYIGVNIRNYIEEEIEKKEFEQEQENNKAVNKRQSVSNKRYSKSF